MGFRLLWRKTPGQPSPVAVSLGALHQQPPHQDEKPSNRRGFYPYKKMVMLACTNDGRMKNALHSPSN